MSAGCYDDCFSIVVDDGSYDGPYDGCCVEDFVQMSKLGHSGWIEVDKTPND